MDISERYPAQTFNHNKILIMTQLKSIILFIAVFLFNNSGKCQDKIEKINGHQFRFEVMKSNQEYNDSSILNIYSESDKLLSHPLYYSEGDCSAIIVEAGKYNINNDSIILYTYWAVADRQPLPLLPYGFRKQIYQVSPDGKLNMVDAKIYIETHLEQNEQSKQFYSGVNKWYHDGINYLDKDHLDQDKVAAIKDYTSKIENEYRARFVLGSEKQALEKEVRSIMKEEIHDATGEWKDGEVYGRVKK